MNPLPFPVRIAAGLVATAVEQARDLPRLVVEFPVTAVSQALQASMRVQQKVTELAIKGDRVLGTLRPVEEKPSWATFDEDEPPSRNGAQRGHRAASARPPGLRARGRPAAARAERRGRPRRRAHRRGGSRGGASPRRRRRPSIPTSRRCWPGYAEMSIPQLRGKLRFLSLDDLRALLAWELAHGERPPFVTMLTNRITAVQEAMRPGPEATAYSRAAVAGAHGRAQDRGVGRPARRGVGGGPARPGHGPARARAPRSWCCATRRRTCRCSSRRPIGLVRGNPAVADGNRVIVHGKPSFFLGRGTLSLRVDEIRAVGIGELLARIERLRKLLAAEGLFDAARKRRPAVPAALHRARHGPGVGGRARRRHQRAGPLARRAVPDREHRRAGRAGRAADRRRAGRARPRPGRRRDRARPRRRQRRGPAAVLRRDAVPGGRRVPHAGGLGDRARAGHAAGRPRRRRPLLDADRGGAAAGARRRRGDRADRGPARPGPPRAGRLGRPRAARARHAAAPGSAIRCGRSTRTPSGCTGCRPTCAARVLRGLDRRAVDLEHARARLTALGPAATLARGYAIVQRVTDDPVLPVLRSAAEVGAGRPAARPRGRRGGRRATVDP